MVAPVLEWLSALRPWTRRALVAVAGILTGFGFQPFNVVAGLFIGVAGFTVLILTAPRREHPVPESRAEQVRALLRWRGFGLGYLYGVAFLTVSLSWVHAVHPLAPIPLIAFEALWFGALGAATVALRALPLWPFWTAGAWSLIEFCYSRVPFGGFGWMRLAYGVVDTPLSGFLPLVGVAGVGYLTALCAQSLAWAAITDSSVRLRIGAVLAATCLIATGLVVRALQPAPPTETVAVGFVQGDVEGDGIDAVGSARSVTNNHLSQTITLIADSRTGRQPQPDFIIWPENSTDADPVTDPITREVVKTALELADVPILVGTIAEVPGTDQRQTVGIWWDPVAGPTTAHYKRNLVPFGEYVPFRDQLVPLVPALSRVGRDSIPGTDSGVLDVKLPDGRALRVGDAICFEPAFDDTMYTLEREAQVIVVQSNNAYYVGTGQPQQQFAITRARAMESQHEILVATTNSLSGYVGADGTIRSITQEGTSASGVFEMPVRTAVTPAAYAGSWIDLGLAIVTFVAVCIALLSAAVRRRPGRMDEAPDRAAR